MRHPRNVQKRKLNQTTNRLQPAEVTTRQSKDPQNELKDIYLDPKNPASYSSNVKAFMQQHASISVHKRRIRNFTRRKIIVPGPFHSISCDLIDYTMYGAQNSGYKYILCVIDMFSRYSYVKPLKNKTAELVAEKLDEIIKSMQFVPKFFTSDKGSLHHIIYIYNCDLGGEFDLRNVFIHEILIEKYHMVVYYTTGPKKNSMVERFNRTIKERIERYFTEHHSVRWVDIVEDFSKNINHTVNRSIGIRPSEVTFENAGKIWRKLYPNQSLDVSCNQIKVGDRVRTAIPKNIFSKGYHQSWTDEIYTVARIEKSMGICLYILKNNEDVLIPNKFYLSELNFVSRNVS